MKQIKAGKVIAGIESSAIAISGYVIVTLIAYMGIRRNVRSEI